MPENIIGKIQTEICKHEGEYGCSPITIQLGLVQAQDLLQRWNDELEERGFIQPGDIVENLSGLENDNIFGIEIKVSRSMQDCLLLIPNKNCKNSDGSIPSR